MTTDATGRMKIVIYYAIWATICAAVAGLVIAGLHTWLFSYIPNRSGLLVTVLSDAVTALAIAAGQGAVALVTGSVLAQFGKGLQRTVLLGLLIGAFDFAMYLLQMAVPATELGWRPDLVILALASATITLLGARSSADSAAS